MNKPKTPRERPELILLSTMTTAAGMAAIRGHIGKAPFIGGNAIPTDSKVAIIVWRRDCTSFTAKAFATRLGIPFHTYKNWQQAAAKSKVAKPAKSGVERVSRTEKLRVAAEISSKIERQFGTAKSKLTAQQRLDTLHAKATPTVSDGRDISVNLPDDTVILGLTITDLIVLAKSMGWLTSTSR